MTQIITYECKFCRKKVAEWNMAAHLQYFHAIDKSSLKHLSADDEARNDARAFEARKAERVKKIQNLTPDERILIAKREQEIRRRRQAETNGTINSAIAKINKSKNASTTIASAWEKNRDLLLDARKKAREFRIYQEELRRMEELRKAEIEKNAVQILRKPVKNNVVSVKRPPDLPLVATVKNGRRGKQGYVPPPTEDCSCGGNNENCYRCSGTGYYSSPLKAEPKNKPKTKKNTHQEVTFSSDRRGGGYAIRESGRFSSNPMHDDYGDESNAS